MTARRTVRAPRSAVVRCAVDPLTDSLHLHDERDHGQIAAWVRGRYAGLVWLDAGGLRRLAAWCTAMADAIERRGA